MTMTRYLLAIYEDGDHHEEPLALIDADGLTEAKEVGEVLLAAFGRTLPSPVAVIYGDAGYPVRVRRADTTLPALETRALDGDREVIAGRPCGSGRYVVAILERHGDALTVRGVDIARVAPGLVQDALAHAEEWGAVPIY